MARTKQKQLVLDLTTWGGARRGSGRKRSGPRGRVAHRRREVRAGSRPVLVTMRVRAEWRGLRDRALLARVHDLLRETNRHGLLHICEIVLLDDHLHMIVESADAATLVRAMHRFAIRFTRMLHGHHGCRGRVWEERYHAADLTTPRRVRAAIAYVLNNARHHGFDYAPGHLDAFSSAAWSDALAPDPTGRRAAPTAPRPTAPPQTWLLRAGWRKHHPLIDPDEVPGRP